MNRAQFNDPVGAVTRVSPVLWQHPGILHRSFITFFTKKIVTKNSVKSKHSGKPQIDISKHSYKVAQNKISNTKLRQNASGYKSIT